MKVTNAMMTMMIATALAPLVLANPESALVSKVNNSGFTTMAGVRQETCSLYADRVVLHKRFGLEPGLELSEERAVRLSGEIQELLAASRQEELLSVENLFCDGPSTTISIAAPAGRPVSARDVLFATGGCGSPSQRREGPATRILRDVIDHFCSRTVDAPRP